MYIPTGNYYTDVQTDYIKIIPKLLILSVSSSLHIENDKNDHKVHKVVAKHFTIHFLYFFSFSITHRISDKAD